MSNAAQAFESLAKLLPNGDYAIRSSYANPAKVELCRTHGKQRIVLVWRSNGKKNELTTRREYVQKLRAWLPGLSCEAAKPDYFATTSVREDQLLETIHAHGAEIASAIAAVDASR